MPETFKERLTRWKEQHIDKYIQPKDEVPTPERVIDESDPVEQPYLGTEGDPVAKQIEEQLRQKRVIRKHIGGEVERQRRLRELDKATKK